MVFKLCSTALGTAKVRDGGGAWDGEKTPQQGESSQHPHPQSSWAIEGSRAPSA